MVLIWRSMQLSQRKLALKRWRSVFKHQESKHEIKTSLSTAQSDGLHAITQKVHHRASSSCHSGLLCNGLYSLFVALGE